MKNTIAQIEERFRLALFPSFLLGILTNIYISGIIIYANYPKLLISPIVGVVIFIVLHYKLKRQRSNSKVLYMIAAYTVALEVVIHTCFFGWDSGFFYFLFLLPIVFLLNSTWKLWMMIFFNSTILALTILLSVLTNYIDGPFLLNPQETLFVAYSNGILTAIIVVVVMIYFSRTLTRKEELLLSVIAHLESSNNEIAKQHEQQKVLLKEIHHRVKNNLQIISSLMSLQSRNVKSKAMVEVLNDCRRRVEAIALIHQKLYQDDKGNSVDFKAYMEDFVLTHDALNPKITFVLNSDDITLHLDVAVPLGLIISEMITNSVKHAFHEVKKPMILIDFVHHGDGMELWVRDNGVGLPDGFDFEQEDQFGLGTDIISALTDQIDAKMSYFNDDGANFKLQFQNRAIV